MSGVGAWSVGWRVNRDGVVGGWVDGCTGCLIETSAGLLSDRSNSCGRLGMVHSCDKNAFDSKSFWFENICFRLCLYSQNEQPSSIVEW